MVYVNSKKFACESCIKGHRSSSCTHNDRPLFEVKKKGRPVSQCEKCREMRQSKRFHSKCICNERKDGAKDGAPSRIALGTKSKRFIPIVPALPNGLKDALTMPQAPCSPADIRQRVNTLLNPCNCKSLWKCRCITSDLTSQEQAGHPDVGISIHATAAMTNATGSKITQPAVMRKVSKRTSSRPSSPSDGKNSSSFKRTKHAKASSPPGPDLPPIFLDTLSPLPTHPAPRIPTFETMPPLSAIKSLAGTGCTCGLRCACPGCVEHRGPEHASTDRNDCADGCGTCVDYTSGIALPTPNATEGTSSSTTSILDRFFARAAALPPPPANRKMGQGIDLDTMNITVYPDAVRSDSDRAVAFGLVAIPKLECCGGACGCPDGTCGCGKACNGCCSEHQVDLSPRPEVAEERQGTGPLDETILAQVELPPVAAPLRSCCAGKSVSVS